MVYGIEFKGDDVKSAGNIFQMDGMIFFSGGNGITVKVEAREYHRRMRGWLDNRMQPPIVFFGKDGSRCTLSAPDAGGDVVVELSHSAG